MKRGTVLAACAAAALLLLAGAAVVVAQRAPPEVVWAFVPDPAWSEDPPFHVAAERGGEPFARERWVLEPVTLSWPRRVTVAHVPPRWWVRARELLGTPVRMERFGADGMGERAAGGRWFRCRRVLAGGAR